MKAQYDAYPIHVDQTNSYGVVTRRPFSSKKKTPSKDLIENVYSLGLSCGGMNKFAG